VPGQTVEAVLQALKSSGVDVIYSSELVLPGLIAPPARDGETLTQRAREALAAHGLALRTVGANTFVVVRAPAPTPAVESEEPLEEISVYASRYAIDGGLAEPREVSPTDIERVPGSHDDALRALHSLPGIATNASARPYIRGSLSEDVLVRYDGIGLLDPFHLKNFQSLISAIDPAGIERIEVFSGGFPVQYGTRSGGVIDISAPNYQSGHEYRANVSLISAGLSTIGKSERWPVEWLGAIRHSVLDMIDPVEDGFGKPEFSDTLGRLRWVTEQGAWTLGWLLLDDRLELGAPDDEEAGHRALSRRVRVARARSQVQRLAEHACQRGGDLGGTRPPRHVLQPGVATGDVDETRSFNGVELANDWTYVRSDSSTYTFGGAVAATRADYRYARHSEFSPEIAAAFARGLTEDVLLAVKPKVATLSLYGANRRKWSRFEAELGLRVDAQHYEIYGNHTQGESAPQYALRLRQSMAPVRVGRSIHAGAARGGVARRRSATGSRFRAGVYPHHSRSGARNRWRDAPRHRGVYQALDHQCAVFRQSTRSVRAVARSDARPHTRRSDCVRSERTRGKRAQTLFRFTHGLGNAGVVACGRRYFSPRRAAKLGSAAVGQCGPGVEGIESQPVGAGRMAHRLAAYAVRSRAAAVAGAKLA
jgi:outer membrane receptor protein involved in Fe transport